MIDPAPPLRGDRVMLPVVFPPMVRVWLFVVWIEETASRTRFPERDAV